MSLAILYATTLPTIIATIAKIATTSAPKVIPKAAAAAASAVPIAAKILPIIGNDFASSAMFFPKAAIPAFPLAPPNQPSALTATALPSGVTFDTALLLFSPVTNDMVFSMLFAATSFAVTTARAENKRFTCIIMLATSPIFPPNMVAIPATEPIAKLAWLAFPAKSETLLIVIWVALASPFCLPILISAILAAS